MQLKWNKDSFYQANSEVRLFKKKEATYLSIF